MPFGAYIRLTPKQGEWLKAAVSPVGAMAKVMGRAALIAAGMEGYKNAEVRLIEAAGIEELPDSINPRTMEQLREGMGQWS